jgi:hypothetical protein
VRQITFGREFASDYIPLVNRFTWINCRAENLLSNYFDCDTWRLLNCVYVPLKCSRWWNKNETAVRAWKNVTTFDLDIKRWQMRSWCVLNGANPFRPLCEITCSVNRYTGDVMRQFICRPYMCRLHPQSRTTRSRCHVALPAAACRRLTASVGWHFWRPFET